MKMKALMVAMAVTITAQAHGYETDDFGFPVEQAVSSRSASNYMRARRTRNYRTVRTTRPRYCPPASTIAVRSQAQPVVATQASRTKAQTVSTVKKATTTSKTTLSATQATVAQPKS